MRTSARLPRSRLPLPALRALGWPALGALALSACWKEDLAEVPLGSLDFTPAIEAPDGWRVTPFQIDLDCPDGTPARFHLVHPEDPAAAPSPAAILFGSGAFDFVFAPRADDPIDGTHYATPSRLDGRWAIRHAYATFGMLPSELPDEEHLGGLVVAFAEQGVPVLVPVNCWGDLWHNRRGIADNDFAADLFARDGRTAAEWAFQMLADPNFALAFGIELPIAVDPARIYLAGLGEGGRAVGELLAADTLEDGVPDYQPAGALVDSHADDLRVMFDDPARFGHVVAGLLRIFPEGRDQTIGGSLFDAPLPPRFAYLYSEGDTRVPVDAHAALLERLSPAHWTHVDPGERHILLDGQDMELARAAVAYLLE